MATSPPGRSSTAADGAVVASPSLPEELDALEERIDAWLATQLAENPIVAAVDRDETPGERRWFVRVHGEQKDTFTIWGDDYANPPRPTRFLIELRWQMEGAPCQAVEVAVTFGPWPSK